MTQLFASRQGPQTTLLRGLLAALLAALVVSIIILSCVPPVSRDALDHHLEIPKLYLQHGGIYEIPALNFSYYPMNLDLLYLLPLYLGNDIAPKFIHFAFALLTAWMIFAYLKRRLNMAYALFGALLFLSVPIIIKLSMTAYVDLGLIFFSFASILYIFKWCEHGFKKRYLIIAGIFCGLALGTKYNGLIVFFLLTLFVPFVHSRAMQVQSQTPPAAISRLRRSGFFRSAGYGALFLVTALIVFSPWMIRNYRWTGNPLYPLYDNFFNAQTQAAPESKSRSMGHFAARKFVYKETAIETLGIPVRIFFQGRDDNPKYFDGRLNPYLIFLPIFAFLGLRKNTDRVKMEKKLLLSFAVLYLLYADVSTDMRIRYIAPIIPPLVILSVYGWQTLVQRVVTVRPQFQHRILYGSVILLVGGLMALNASYLYSQFRIVQPLAYLSGKVSRDAYIERFRPEYAAMTYINRRLPADAKILAFFVGRRGYYCSRPIFFAPPVFDNALVDQTGTAKFLAVLKTHAITHLLIRYDLFGDWLARLDNRKRNTMVHLIAKKARLLYAKGGYGLLALVSPGSSS